MYVDPPWTFKTYSDKGKEKSPEQHYQCMTLEDIYSLPISDIAADDCVLFLWVTFPLLREGLEAIRRWGFEYKTCAFNWVKRNKKSDSWFWGLGYWTRSNSELCLLATKGYPPPPEPVGTSDMRRARYAAQSEADRNQRPYRFFVRRLAKGGIVRTGARGRLGELRQRD